MQIVINVLLIIWILILSYKIGKNSDKIYSLREDTNVMKFKLDFYVSSSLKNHKEIIEKMLDFLGLEVISKDKVKQVNDGEELVIKKAKKTK